MLGVIVHPIGRDQRALDDIGARGAGVAERIRPGAGAGVLGNVADARHQRQPGRHREKPDAEEPDARAAQSEHNEQDRVGDQEAQHLIGAAGEKALVRIRVVGRTSLEQRQKQRQSLFHESLAGEVADRLAGKTFLGDRKRRGQRQIRILRLLRKSMMLQVVGAVAGKIGPNRHCAQPLPDPFVDRLVRMQAAVRGLVHQDGEAQLPRADDHHRDQPRQRIGPDRHQRNRCRDGAPGVRHQPATAP